MKQVKNQKAQQIPRMSLRYRLVWWLIDTAAAVFFGGALWLHSRANPSVSNDMVWYGIAFGLFCILYGGFSNVIDLLHKCHLVC